MSPSLDMSFWCVTLTKTLRKSFYRARIVLVFVVVHKISVCRTTYPAYQKPYCWRSIRGYILEKRIFSKILDTHLSKLIGRQCELSALSSCFFEEFFFVCSLITQHPFLAVFFFPFDVHETR